MNQAEFPQSDDCDIALVLEGTYPFVRGGVANWVYELIRAFPQYRFAVIFLGTKAEDYPQFHYPIADNLVHLQAHFLFETHHIPEHKEMRIDKASMKKIDCLHHQFQEYLNPDFTDLPELFDIMEDQENVNEARFLRSKESWQYILEKYKENYADQSFFDYFWGIRNLHRPFWDLAKIVDKVPRFKLLHTASTGYAGFLGALLQKRYQVPYLITEHGIYTKERWIELMRHHFFEYVVKEHSQDSSERGLLSIWMRFFTILAKVAYSRSYAIVSLFEEYRQRQIADGAPADKTKIVPYGIDFNHYRFLDKPGPNKDKPVIAMVGRVVPIKDVKTFIRACALLRTRMPNLEAWIVGAMDEDPEYVSNCKSLVDMLNVPDTVKFLGVQNMMELFPKIDLVVLTSISEGAPFVLLESFAVGIPVVSSNVGGCPDLVEGKDEHDRALGPAGKLVNIADPEAVAQATVALLSDEMAWRSAQKAGFERVRRYYGMEQLIQNYNSLYKEAIENGRNRI